MNPNSHLQVLCAWQRRLLGYKLLSPRDSLVVGPSKRAGIACPGFDGAPKLLPLCTPAKGGGFRLRLAPGMSGHIESRARGKEDVLGISATPVTKRFGNKLLRDVELAPGDVAVIDVVSANLRFQISFVEPPEPIARPSSRDGNFFSTGCWAPQRRCLERRLRF